MQLTHDRHKGLLQSLLTSIKWRSTSDSSLKLLLFFQDCSQICWDDDFWLLVWGLPLDPLGPMLFTPSPVLPSLYLAHLSASAYSELMDFKQMTTSTWRNLGKIKWRTWHFKWIVVLLFSHYLLIILIFSVTLILLYYKFCQRKRSKITHNHTTLK